jgi:hypothetical protein
VSKTPSADAVIKEATAKMNARHPMGFDPEYAAFQVQVAILREIVGLREDLKKVIDAQRT